MKSWIQTLEGRKLEPRWLTPDMVGSIEEVAHSLAGKYRFTCQTKKRYSVAEHCVRGSFLLPPVFAGAFLLHELSEVYGPDIAAPMKQFVWVEVPVGHPCKLGGGHIPWSNLECHQTDVMLNALGLSSLKPLIYSPEVKRMDLAMLAAEKRDLCGPEPEDWCLTVPPADTEISRVWEPEVAARAFTDRFYDLFGRGI